LAARAEVRFARMGGAGSSRFFVGGFKGLLLARESGGGGIMMLAALG